MRLENVSFDLTRLSFRDLNESFPEQQITVILGPNGAGKTTLLKLLSGVRKPHKGKVLLSEKALGDYKARELAMLRSVVEQQHDAMIDSKVMDYVALSRYPYNENDQQTYEIVEDQIAKFNLAAFSESYFSELSGGEQQLVRICKAFVQLENDHEHQWILMDEPTKGLDYFYQERIISILRERVAQGASIILVLHDIDIAARIADHIVLIKNGQIVANAAVRDALNPDILHQVFNARFKKTRDGRWLVE